MPRFGGVRWPALQVAAVGLVALGVTVGPPAVRWAGHLAAGKPTLKVDRLGPAAVGGVIAAGEIDGRHWQIRLRSGKNWRGTWQCAPAGQAATNCVLGQIYLWATRFPQRKEPAYLAVFDPQVVSQVKANVTEVSVRLSDGDMVWLRPVRAYGRHWIGLLLPDGVSIDLVTAYANGAELAHSTPFANGQGQEFLSWLPPGDAGPAPTTKIVNAAVVPGDKLYIGPWGICIGWPPSFMSCWPVGSRVTNWSSDYPATNGSSRAVVVSVAPGASYLVLTLSSGRNLRVPVVRGPGVAFAAFQVRSESAILRWAVYDRAGRRLAGGQGAPGDVKPSRGRS